MIYNTFIQSLKNNSPPIGISKPMQAMSYAKKGNWYKAHQIAQNITSDSGSWIHAYLHRVEGEESNARYSYNRANIKPINTDFNEEAKRIITHILDLN